jgi:hypothetical protein
LALLLMKAWQIPLSSFCCFMGNGVSGVSNPCEFLICVSFHNTSSFGGHKNIISLTLYELTYKIKFMMCW